MRLSDIIDFQGFLIQLELCFEFSIWSFFYKKLISNFQSHAWNYKYLDVKKQKFKNCKIGYMLLHRHNLNSVWVVNKPNY